MSDLTSRTPDRVSTAMNESNGGPVVEIGRLEAQLPNLRASYQAATPFPHIVLDDFLEPAVLDAAVNAFPSRTSADWISYVHVNERKFGNNRPGTWPPVLRSLLDQLQSDRFVAFLAELTGIDGLFADQSLEGGGLHLSESGGFLNIHADFTVHPGERTWRRRVNLLLYLNGDWPDAYGGELELWTADMKRCERRVSPRGNRVVIFNTDADSFHGHPAPLACPPDVARQSLALYYFTAERDPLVRSTEYRARPGDGAKGALIFLDKEVLRAYDWAKRRLGISDRFASSALGRLERLRHKPQNRH